MPRCSQDIIITNGVKEVKIWKDYLSNPTLTMDEYRATKSKLLQAGVALIYVKLNKKG